MNAVIKSLKDMISGMMELFGIWMFFIGFVGVIFLFLVCFLIYSGLSFCINGSCLKLYLGGGEEIVYLSVCLFSYGLFLMYFFFIEV